MKYFHVYDHRTFDGLVKHNFITEDTGFKLQHTYQIPSERKFNREAATGSKLHSLIKEGSHPFYVDRLTGGLRYHPYYFDKSLIREYRNLLGDWFLGFQQHELLGRRADWKRVAEVNEKLGRYLTVFNNEGNNRTLAEGDHVDHAAADATTTIRTKPGVELSILYTSSPATKLEKRTDGEYSLFLPATDLVIFNY